MRKTKIRQSQAVVGQLRLARWGTIILDRIDDAALAKFSELM